MAKESMSAIAGMAGFPGAGAASELLSSGLNTTATSGGPFEVGDRAGPYVNFGTQGQAMDFKTVGLMSVVAMVGLLVVLKAVK